MVPLPGWVEQSPVDLWQSQLEPLTTRFKQVGVEDFRAVALANQRETSLIWNRDTLEPLGRRSSGSADERRQSLPNSITFTELKCGCVPGSNPTHTFRTQVLLATRPSRRCSRAGRSGRVGLWNRRLLAADQTDEWCRPRDRHHERLSDDALELGRASMGRSALFLARRADLDVAGGTTERWRVRSDRSHAVRSSVADPRSRGRSTGCTLWTRNHKPGTAKCTYGTGAFLLSHAGRNAATASTPDGLLLTAAAEGGFAYEGGVFTAGSVVQWLRGGIRLAPTAPEISSLAASTEHSAGVMVIRRSPALVHHTGIRMHGEQSLALLGAQHGRRSRVRHWRPWHSGFERSSKPWSPAVHQSRSCVSTEE